MSNGFGSRTVKGGLTYILYVWFHGSRAQGNTRPGLSNDWTGTHDSTPRTTLTGGSRRMRQLIR